MAGETSGNAGASAPVEPDREVRFLRTYIVDDKDRGTEDETRYEAESQESLAARRAAYFVGLGVAVYTDLPDDDSAVTTPSAQSDVAKQAAAKQAKEDADKAAAAKAAGGRTLRDDGSVEGAPAPKGNDGKASAGRAKSP